MENKCFECGSNDQIHNHHVVPKIRGGTKTIPLCVICHGKVHNIDFTNHKILTKQGLKKAKERGVKLGSPQNLTDETRIKGRKTIQHNAKNCENWKLAKEFIEINKPKNKKINLTEMSNLLNENNFRTRRGCKFNPATVKRLLKS
jgi:hypothetical protein